MNKNKKVMVVEDDSDIRETLITVLELEGFEVIEAQNGQVAIDVLKSLSPLELPGLIILDLMMPIMDGQTFVKVLQADYKHLTKLPIVLASANLRNISDDVRNSVVEILRKPLNIDDLYRLVHQYCGPSAS